MSHKWRQHFTLLPCVIHEITMKMLKGKMCYYITYETDKLSFRQQKNGSSNPCTVCVLGDPALGTLYLDKR